MSGFGPRPALQRKTMGMYYLGWAFSSEEACFTKKKKFPQRLRSSCERKILPFKKKPAAVHPTNRPSNRRRSDRRRYREVTLPTICHVSGCSYEFVDELYGDYYNDISDSKLPPTSLVNTPSFVSMPVGMNCIFSPAHQVVLSK